MTKKTTDTTATLKDMLAGFQLDNTAFEGAFRNVAELNEKLAGAALDAASKSAELSNKWTRDALDRMAGASKAQAEPAEYAKAYSDLASASAEVAAENMAAFAEIAKKLQQDTVALLTAAGKTATEDASEAVRKATEDMSAAAGKAMRK